MNNPFHKANEGWFFYDEAYVEYGPYATEEEAIAALQRYIDIYLS